MTPQQLNKYLQKFYLFGKKARRNILQKKNRSPLFGQRLDRYLSSPPLNKPFSIIGPLFIELVWYILKQLFTSVSVNSGGY